MRSKWDEVAEKLELIKGWATDGLYERDICENLGISRQTFSKYKKEHKELTEALKIGREHADYIVQNATFKLACGFKVKVKKHIKMNRSYVDDNGILIKEEYLEPVEDEQYIPPNATTQMFWLKRRMPDKWGELPKDTEALEKGVVFLPEVTTAEETLKDE